MSLQSVPDKPVLSANRTSIENGCLLRSVGVVRVRRTKEWARRRRNLASRGYFSADAVCDTIPSECCARWHVDSRRLGLGVGDGGKKADGKLSRLACEGEVTPVLPKPL